MAIVKYYFTNNSFLSDKIREQKLNMYGENLFE